MSKRRQLEEQFSEEEVMLAVKDCSSFKAPGPDGFNFNFVKKAWGIINDDIMLFLKEFHSNGKILKGLNSTFVALIPKIDNPLHLKILDPLAW